MGLPQTALLKLLTDVLGRLRFPQLFLLVAALFLFDLFVPDIIPFLDEILLGLATLLLGSWKENREAPGSGDPPSDSSRDRAKKTNVIDVEPLD